MRPKPNVKHYANAPPIPPTINQDHDRVDARREFCTLAGLLVRAAERWPDHGVRYLSAESAAEPARFTSYHDLLEQAQRIGGGLVAAGLRPGDRIGLMLETAAEFIPAFWGSVLSGFVPCPIAPLRQDPERWAMHLRQVHDCLRSPWLLTSAAIKQEGPEIPGLEVSAIEDLRDHLPRLAIHQAAPHDSALLVLTSGSTGRAKAVILTHGNLLASLPAKAARQRLGAHDATLNWVSFDHVAALIECHLLPLYTGANQMHVPPVEIMNDPARFVQLLAAHRVTMTFTPNFLLSQINAAPVDSGIDLSCVRAIICGGEAVVCATARTFLEQLRPFGLSADTLWPAFGMTETCAGSVYSHEFPAADAGREFASLGTAIDGLEMRIAGENGGAVPDGQVGELELHGPMVFPGYFGNPEATQASFSDDGWFRTGNRGSIVGGRLSLAGRSKDSIIVNGVNYHPHELEAALEPIAGLDLSFTAVFPTRPAGAVTEQLAIVFSPSFSMESATQLRDTIAAIRNTTVRLWGFRPAVILALPRTEIPKTSLGKIQRPLLRQRLEIGAFAADLERQAGALEGQYPYIAPANETEARLAAIFGEVVGVPHETISTAVSFFDSSEERRFDLLRLCRKVADAFDRKDVTVATVLMAASVRQLAHRLDCEGIAVRGDAGYQPALALQTSGAEPLFCFHPGVGEVLVFVDLAKQFVGKRPVFALRARGFGSEETHFGSWSEMIDAYVRGIRAQKRSGPYLLAGYSFGGVVAFEVAKVLEAMGERVDLLGIINVPPHIQLSRKQIDETYTRVNLAFLLSLIAAEEVQPLTSRFRAEGIPPAVQATLLLQKATQARLTQLDLDETKFLAWGDLAFGLVRLGRTYEPAGRVRTATVFYTSPPVRYQGMERQRWRDEHLRAWDRFADAVSYVEVEGEHQTLMSRDLPQFYTALATAIERGTTSGGMTVESSS